MKEMKCIFRRILSLSLAALLALSLCGSAFADVRFGIAGGSGNTPMESNGIPSLRESGSKSSRADYCQEIFNTWWKEKAYKSEYNMDDFASIDVLKKGIRQIDILSRMRQDSRNSSFYSPFDELTVTYYYINGLPYYAFIYDDSYDEALETRLYISEGEIVAWKNAYGEKGSNEPEQFSYIYEHALAAYSRAMSDHFNRGRYSIDMGTFKDSNDALACYASLKEIGINARIEIIDNIYCILVGDYSNWDAAADAAAKLDMTDECGVMFIRCL